MSGYHEQIFGVLLGGIRGADVPPCIDSPQRPVSLTGARTHKHTHIHTQQETAEQGVMMLL